MYLIFSHSAMAAVKLQYLLYIIQYIHIKPVDLNWLHYTGSTSLKNHATMHCLKQTQFEFKKGISAFCSWALLLLNGYRTSLKHALLAETWSCAMANKEEHPNPQISQF